MRKQPHSIDMAMTMLQIPWKYRLDGKAPVSACFPPHGRWSQLMRRGWPAHCFKPRGWDSRWWQSQATASGLASFARGVNDAPKLAAMVLLESALAAWPSAQFQVSTFAAVAVAMGLGNYLGGLRVTEVLAEKVTTMDHAEGLSANLTTSSLVLVSATLGLPVSTTHVSGSAIIGIGLLKGVRAVRWKTVREMVLAWIVTLPASAMLTWLAYFLLARLN